MQFLQNVKNVELFTASAFNSSVQTAINGAFDTQGFEEAEVIIGLSLNASSASLSAVLQNSDTNGSFTTIAGLPPVAYSLPGLGTGLYGWQLDLRGANAYKRWINVQIAIGYSVTGVQDIYGVAILGRPGIGIYQAGGTATTQVEGGNGFVTSVSGYGQG